MDSKNTEQDATTTKKGQTKKERKIPFGLHFIIGKRAYLKEKKEGGKIKKKKKKCFPQRTWASFPDKDKSGRKEMYTCTVQHTQAQIKKDLKKYLSLHTPVLSSH